MEYRCCKLYDSEALVVATGLRLAEIMHAGYFEEPSPSLDETAVPYNLKELTVSDTLACSCCRKSFVDSLEQRSHYKLDWHRYNLKRTLSGNEPVTEENFLLNDEDISSISGSECDSGSDESNDETDCDKKKQAPEGVKVLRHIKVFFENSSNEVLSIYKCLLQGKKENLVTEDLINSALNIITKPKKWMIVMLGGGHFAAAIFDNEKMTHHKTFHCYTVRAKQGGSQSARDKKGGSHPKSAGASLRRYNEQALVQHIQDIMSAWTEAIEQCNLILYRAPGPWNRSTLFGGKKAPLNKADKRLRNISFPTRRATLKELKRVHDMLSNIEIYGYAEDFKTKFPKSPDKRLEASDRETEKEKKIKVKKIRRKIERSLAEEPETRKRQDIAEEIPESSSEEDQDTDVCLVWNDSIIDLNDLREYEDTVPGSLVEMKNGQLREKGKHRKKRKDLLGTRSKGRTHKDEILSKIRRNLLNSCRIGNEISFSEVLTSFNDFSESEENRKPSDVLTKNDLIVCLNGPIDEETENTLLHVCAIECLPDFIGVLLSNGADPTIRNKNHQTPYMAAGDKKTKNSFRQFVASFPDKFDLKKANIPPPLTAEKEKEREEKKKEKRKTKQAKEKLKKQKNKELKRENEEKEKFLALSDREKCALAAERRLLASMTANMKSSKPPVLSRCFECGTDITGKIPFEYGTNRFCSMPCLKAHRAKTKSYGINI